MPHLLRSEIPLPPATASRDIIWATCPADALGLDPAVFCGYLPAPLDRQHPNREKINIYFELYLHTNPGPARSAILVANGGPGLSTTFFRSIWWMPIFQGNLDVHDLLLIDQRGRGLSGAIDCSELQHGTAPIERAVSDCAAQLGDAASRYGTGDVAQDIDAVRSALGYNKVDYYGVSSGGVDVIAYATRFGEHLRSIVLDAPDGPPDLKQFAGWRYSAYAQPRAVRLVCQRSPACSADHPNPDADLDSLIESIRRHPLEGEAYDASGNIQHVKIDEAALFNYVVAPAIFSNPLTNTGELLAAATAFGRGDTRPLLRLGAETFVPLLSDSGDPTIYSAGDSFAATCADAEWPWDWSQPVYAREEQYTEAVGELPPGYFAPYSKPAVTSSIPGCVWWQKHTPSSPVVPPHATYPSAPALVLSGDIDTYVPLEEASQIAALFPGSTFVPVAEAGHPVFGWSHCGTKLESLFLETMRPGDTSCTKTPEVVWPAVGRFPLRAEQARPAQVDPDGHNQIGEAERKVVTVAVAAATDALQRSIIGSGNGVGLRAGTFHTVQLNTAWHTTLTNCAFAIDVTVNGTVTWGGDNSLVADLTVSGAGTSGGTLHIEGSWQAPGPVGNFTITGTLGGKHVAVLVPEA